MIPVLFKSTEVDFTSNGLGALNEIYDVDIEEQRNGLFQLKAYYPINGQRFKDIEVGNIILAKPNPTGALHAFRIVVADKDLLGHSLEIEADSITYDLTHNLVKKVIVEGNGQTFMSILQKETVHPHLFKFYSDIKHITKTTLEYVNPMEAMAGVQGSFLQMWGGEMLRENRKVSMLQRRGKDNVTSFRIGKNINGLKHTVDMGDLVTQIVPTVTIQEGNKNRVIEGKTVTSQHANKYPIIYTKMIDVSETVSFKDDATDDEIKAKIDAYASNWFTQSQNTGKDKPKVSVDIDVLSLQDSADYQEKFKDLETVQLTDTVTVYVPEYGINVLASVNEIHYDPLREQVTNLKVGVAKLSFASANKNQLNELQNKITQIREDATEALQSANGKNSNFYGRYPPKHPQEGDTWFWEDGEHKGIKVFQNGEWVDVVDDKTQERIDLEIDKAIEEAKKHADELNRVTNERFNETVKHVEDGMKEIQPSIDKAKQELSSDMNKAVGKVEVDLKKITSFVNDPVTGLSSTRLQFNNAIQNEIANRKTGDTNTLTQAKDFTTSQIKSSETGMKSMITQTSDAFIASISNLNYVIDSNLVNKHAQWAFINQSGVSTVGKGFYFTSATRYKGVPSAGINTTGQGATYKFLSARDIARGDFPSANVYVSVDVLVRSMGGTENDCFIVYIHELDANKKPVKSGKNISGTIGGEKNNGVNGKWTNYRKTITLDPNTKFVRLTYQMRGNGNVYVARPYIGADKLPDGGYSAGPADTITTTLQLFKDSFLLGLKDNSGAIVTGINGDASGLRLAGKKLTLDGDTVVNGDFYAKGGSFKNLNASNLTTGTLNAANVKLINLDAGSISSGFINAARIAAKSITADKLAANAIQVGFNALGNTINLSSTALDFKNGGVLQARLNGTGMEFWRGTKKIGWMGSTNKSGNTAVLGIENTIDFTGDFITWAFKETATSKTTTAMLTLDPKGKMTGKKGVVFGQPAFIDQLGVDGADNLRIGPVGFNNGKYPSITNLAGTAGIFMGANMLFLHKNVAYEFGDLVKLINGLKGEKFAIPTGIDKTGKITGWKNIKF